MRYRRNIAVIVSKMTEAVTTLNQQISVFTEKVQGGELDQSLEWVGVLGVDLAELSVLLVRAISLLGDSVMENALGWVTIVFDKAVALGINSDRRRSFQWAVGRISRSRMFSITTSYLQ